MGVKPELTAVDKRARSFTFWFLGAAIAGLVVFFIVNKMILPQPVDVDTIGTGEPLPERAPVTAGATAEGAESGDTAESGEGESAESGEGEGAAVAEGERPVDTQEPEAEAEALAQNTEEQAVAAAENEAAAEAEAEALAEAGGDGAAYEALLAEAEGLRGRSKVAKLREAVAVNPNGAVANAELGFELLNRGRYREAAEFAERATMLEPTSSMAWITLGAARQALRDRDGANEAYRQCVELGTGEYVRECRRML
ncbi:MAG: hypothetical protein AAF447_26820 [Myxococcota bacterium]